MKKLKDEISKRGMKMYKGYEGEDFYIYITFIEGWFNSYEVFRKKIAQPWTYCDEESEQYPSDEDFGRWAWACSNNDSLDKILDTKMGLEDFERENVVSAVVDRRLKIQNLVAGKGKLAPQTYGVVEETTEEKITA